MGYLFVSYSHDDEEAVGRLAEALGEADYLLWLDSVPDDLPGGSLWPKKIVGAIRGADAFLLMVSLPSMASDEVRRELHLAADHQIQVIPLQLEPATIPDEFAYHLSGIQRIDFSIDWQDGLDRLFKVLRDSDDARTASESGIDPDTRRRIQAVFNDSGIDIADKSLQMLRLMSEHVWKQEHEAFAKVLEHHKRSLALQERWLEVQDRKMKLYKDMRGNQQLSGLAHRTLRKEVRALKSKLNSIDKDKEALTQSETEARDVHAKCRERRLQFQALLDEIQETERGVLDRLNHRR